MSIGKGLARFSIEYVHSRMLSGIDRIEFVVEERSNKRFQCYLNSDRLHLFLRKGVSCVCCGIKGEYYLAELCGNPSPHLNLYSSCGRLMTKDHIFPVSKGGSNRFHNLQTMCTKCNARKSNNIENLLFSTRNFRSTKDMEEAIKEGVLVEGINA